MPVSPWFYANLPGYDKNWLWSSDDLWFDRWQEVWSFQPEWVEILTWNDFGESHYIGPLVSRISSHSFNPIFLGATAFAGMKGIV